MKTIKNLRKQIEKDFGKKCKNRSHICAVCIAYNALECLEDLFLIRKGHL